MCTATSDVLAFGLSREFGQRLGSWSVLASLLHPVGASRDMDRGLGAPLPIRSRARSKTTQSASAMLLSVLLRSKQVQREKREPWEATSTRTGCATVPQGYRKKGAGMKAKRLWIDCRGQWPSKQCKRSRPRRREIHRVYPFTDNNQKTKVSAQRRVVTMSKLAGSVRRSWEMAGSIELMILRASQAKNQSAAYCTS